MQYHCPVRGGRYFRAAPCQDPPRPTIAPVPPQPVPTRPPSPTSGPPESDAPPGAPSPRPGKRPGVFRGWYVVAAVFAVMTVCSGLGVYCISVFLHGFVASDRFPIEQVSFASGGFAVASNVVGLWVGRLLERYDARRVITGGALLMAAALAALPLVRDTVALYGFFVLLGIGYGGAALIPGTTVVARWFTTQRATALSVAATGNSFGAVVLVPPVALLVGALGLDGAARWMALALLIGTLPVTWFVLRSWPHDVGLAPQGSGTVHTPGGARVQGDIGYDAAVRTRYYRMFALSFLLGMAAHVGGQTHIFNLLMQRLEDPAQAGSAVAMMAACSVLARFAAVAALRRISTRRFIMVLLVLKGVALAGCGLATNTTVLLLWVALFGSTLGNFITAQSVLLAEAFGVTAYARLYGLSRVVATPGVLLGPGLMGLLYGLGQSYAMPYLTVAAVSMSGIAALLLCGPSPQRPLSAP